MERVVHLTDYNTEILSENQIRNQVKRSRKSKNQKLTSENTKTKKTRKTNSKRKGNLFENKIAKLLGEWMTGDSYFLTRHITSGAIKHAYVGDIVPQKKFHFNNGVWPFLIECKYGYQKFIPTLNNQKIVRQWLEKCIDDSKNEQKIIILIAGFQNYSPLFITNQELVTHPADLILVHLYKFKYHHFYVYQLKEVLALDFNQLYIWD